MNDVHQRAEAEAARALRDQGFRVTNLNDIAGNFPVIDLAARRGGDLLLVQVRGSGTKDGKFRAAPEDSRAVATLSDALGGHGIWAFVHFAPDGALSCIRFEAAETVRLLAEEDIAATPSRNMFHVNITQFETGPDGIRQFLAAPAQP